MLTIGTLLLVVSVVLGLGVLVAILAASDRARTMSTQVRGAMAISSNTETRYVWRDGPPQWVPALALASTAGLLLGFVVTAAGSVL